LLETAFDSVLLGRILLDLSILGSGAAMLPGGFFRGAMKAK
jgi:hypothetical protein